MTALTLQQAFDLALRHRAAGQLAQAESILRQILVQQPDEPQVMHMLGLIAYQRGDHSGAIEWTSRAIAINSTVAVYHNTLATAMLASGNVDLAIASLLQALQLDPALAEAHNNLGNAYRMQNRDAEAIAAYRAAIAANPRFAPALVNLANAEKSSGACEQAINTYRAAIVLDPRLPEAHVNLGVALCSLERAAEALAPLQTAVALCPGLPAAHFNLGVALKHLGRTDEAVSAYRAAIRLSPAFADAHSNLGSALFEQGSIPDALDSFRRAISVSSNAMVAHSNLCYTMHFDPTFDARQIFQEHLMWARRFADPLKWEWTPHSSERDPARRLRVGYVSPDFHQHPIARFLLPLLERHDAEQFEIFGYSDCPHPDAYTHRVRTATAQWRDIRGMKNHLVARLIREDRIDILIDLSAHMRDHRLRVFACHPAPVQATYLAYCSTTGMDAIRYRISDPFLDPQEADQSVYVERTIRVPRCYWCYEPPPQAPQVSPPPSGTAGGITFGCLNNFAKVSPPALEAFCRILKAVPGSRLILHAYPGSQRQRPLDALRRAGIDPSRLSFMPALPLEEFLAMHHQIDIALDSFPYNGGTTSCDAMWMGVPMITLAGRTAVGRGGSTLLHNLGMPELIARSAQAYVDLAVALAQDRERLAQLRRSLRERMRASPLMDAAGFVRDFERIYREIWQEYCREDML